MDSIEEDRLHQQGSNGSNGVNIAAARGMWCHECKFEFVSHSSQCSKCKGYFVEVISSGNADSNSNYNDPRNFIPYGDEPTSSNTNSQHQNNVHTASNQYHPSPLTSNPPPPVMHQNFSQLIQQPFSMFAPLPPQSSATASVTISFGGSTGSMHNPSTTNASGSFLGFNQLISNFIPQNIQSIPLLSNGGLFNGLFNHNHQSLDNILDFIMRNDTNVHGSPPANEESVRSLPRIKISQLQSSQEECIVCKEEFTVDEESIQMPCGHLFHPPCILAWLKMHNSCPTCRHELPTDNQDYEMRKNQQNQQNNH